MFSSSFFDFFFQPSTVQQQQVKTTQVTLHKLSPSPPILHNPQSTSPIHLSNTTTKSKDMNQQRPDRPTLLRLPLWIHLIILHRPLRQRIRILKPPRLFSKRHFINQIMDIDVDRLERLHSTRMIRTLFHEKNIFKGGKRFRGKIDRKDERERDIVLRGGIS